MQPMPMTPADYFEIVKRRKWSLALPAVIIFLLAGIVALVLPAVYKSESTILIEEQEIPEDFVTATVTGYAEQRIQQINQRIMSFTRLMEIIQRFELYPELQDKWTTEEIVEKMKEDTRLEPVSAEIVDKRTGRPSTATIAFTLSYEGKDPQKVQQVTNVLTSLFLEENLQVREKQAQETSAFLEGEMERVKAELAQIDSQIAGFKEEHINELPEMLQLNLQSLNNIERNIELSAQQLRTLKEKEEYLQTQLASIAPFEEAHTSRQRLEDLKVELVHLTKRFSDEYPDVVKARAEIAELENQLAEAERKLGIAKRLAALFPDGRDPTRVLHALADILRARMLAIAAGYEDADDLDALRRPIRRAQSSRRAPAGRDLSHLDLRYGIGGSRALCRRRSGKPWGGIVGAL